MSATTEITITYTDVLSFADLLAQVYARRFTGMLILHCAEGIPRKVEFPTQVIPGRQVTITGGGR